MNILDFTLIILQFSQLTNWHTWNQIYEESEKQLYKEIDYLNEAANTKRFQKDFEGYDWVKIPSVIEEVTTPRVLVMEYVEAFKLTDVKRIDELGLDRKLLARRVADWFLRQIVETSFFHCDPHSGASKGVEHHAVSYIQVDTNTHHCFFFYPRQSVCEQKRRTRGV